MEDNLKYFTPEIEDLHVGYKGEYRETSYFDWFPFIIDDLFRDTMGYGISEYAEYLLEDNLRTPFLTKEQIESEGWELYSKGIDLWFKKEVLVENFDWSGLNNLYGYKPYKLFLNYGLHDHKIHIKCDFSGGGTFADSDTLFEGYCPSINEFKIICKLLKIN